MKRLLFVLGFLLLLGARAEAADRYADRDAINCINGAVTYDPATRECGAGAATVYIGASAVQTASNASSAGDRVLIRGSANKYTGTGESNHVAIKEGTSASVRLTYEGYQNEMPILLGMDANNPLISGTADFVTLKKLILDPGGAQGTSCIINIRFAILEDMICRNAGHHGIFGIGDSVITRSRFTNNGFNSTDTGGGDKGYGIYTGSSSDNVNNIIRDSEFDNNGGHGINCYNAPFCGPLTIERTRIRDNGWNGIFIASGSGTIIIRNTLVYDNGHGSGGGFHGIHIGSATGTVTMQNLTVVGNSAFGVCANFSTVGITNTIALGNGGGQLSGSCHSGSGTINQTTNTITGTTSIFADYANEDLRLCTSLGDPHATCSSADVTFNTDNNIGQGTDLSGTFTTDFFGTTRASPWSKSAIEPGTGGEEPPPPPIPTLIVEMSCDNVVTDSSGNANHGTLTGGATFSAMGKYNQACSLDGVDDYVNVADSATLDELTHAFTLSAWVKPTSVTNSGVIISKTDPVTADHKFFLFGSITGFCGTSTPMGGFIQENLITACHGTPLSTADWTHIALTYNSQAQNPQLLMYKNGSVITSGDSSAVLDTTTGALRIGASVFGEYFAGLIDEVRIYNYARTSTQVVTDMNTPINPLSEEEDNTIIIKLNVSSIKFEGTTLRFGEPPQP